MIPVCCIFLYHTFRISASNPDLLPPAGEYKKTERKQTLPFRFCFRDQDQAPGSSTVQSPCRMSVYSVTCTVSCWACSRSSGETSKVYSYHSEQLRILVMGLYMQLPVNPSGACQGNGLIQRKVQRPGIIQHFCLVVRELSPGKVIFSERGIRQEFG